jgi:capsular exopolysaccharide synthesis family protein
LFLLALFVGPIAGFLLSFGTFVVIDFINNTVRDASEVETKFKLPVLATIPIILNTDEIPDDLPLERRMDAKLITSDYAPSIAGEKFRLLRTRLLLDAERSQRPIIVSSINPGDGKSLVSSNLSITYAQQKMPTVLIDADLRRGVLHNSFGLSKKPGLADLLVSNSKITAAALSKIIQNTHIPNLFLIPSGIQIPNPSELLGGERMRQVIEKLQDKYQKIILDTPPLSFIPDALVLNSFVHNILFVVRYGRTNLNELDTKLSELANTRSDILGLIINASVSTNDRTKYSYSYYHY